MMVAQNLEYVRKQNWPENVPPLLHRNISPDIGRVDSASLPRGRLLHVGQDRLLLLRVGVTLPGGKK